MIIHIKFRLKHKSLTYWWKINVKPVQNPILHFHTGQEKKCAELIPVLCLSHAGGQATKQQPASADRRVSTALWSSHRHPQLAQLLLQHNPAKMISVINQANVKVEKATTSTERKNLWEIFQSTNTKERCAHGLGRWENTTLNLLVSAQITRRLSNCPKIINFDCDLQCAHESYAGENAGATCHKLALSYCHPSPKKTITASRLTSKAIVRHTSLGKRDETLCHYVRRLSLLGGPLGSSLGGRSLGGPRGGLSSSLGMSSLGVARGTSRHDRSSPPPRLSLQLSPPCRSSLSLGGPRSSRGGPRQSSERSRGGRSRQLSPPRRSSLLKPRSSSLLGPLSSSRLMGPLSSRLKGTRSSSRLRGTRSSSRLRGTRSSSRRRGPLSSSRRMGPRSSLGGPRRQLSKPSLAGARSRQLSPPLLSSGMRSSRTLSSLGGPLSRQLSGPRSSRGGARSGPRSSRGALRSRQSLSSRLSPTSSLKNTTAWWFSCSNIFLFYFFEPVLVHFHFVTVRNSVQGRKLSERACLSRFKKDSIIVSDLPFSFASVCIKGLVLFRMQWTGWLTQIID